MCALLLSVVEELGTAEMAEVMGRSESAVRALLFLREDTAAGRGSKKEDARDEEFWKTRWRRYWQRLRRRLRRRKDRSGGMFECAGCA